MIITKYKTGEMSVQLWSECMQSVLGMDLPWRKLKSKLVKSTTSGLVSYRSTFELTIQNKLKEKVYTDVTFISS